MSENRDTPPGAPVEETETSRSDVRDAVERARDSAEEAGAGDAAAVETVVVEETVVETVVDADGAAAEQVRREKLAAIDTELDLEPAGAAAGETSRLTTLDDLPSAAADTPVAAASDARDGEIRISSDHPMAAFYVQTPMPPDIKGNRGGGVLIAILATLGFAAVYAGVLALWIAPSTPPSQFVDRVTELALNWGFIAGVVAFLLGLVLLVLIFGRAGWWAYVLGGFFVGALVWIAATIGSAVSADGVRVLFERSPLDNIGEFGLSIPAIAAALVAREATIWFGAWIGARGRKLKTRNAEALAEYEVAVAEAQAKQA
ncbi:hypothetical protein MUN76_05335 [Leucobacter rhizosphaerae]|uniref:ABC transporter n=1 Tax=Leucobacter rhizosphaerae TaxID=2932245 RepID=A0ABY4FYM2_9MICO|nr:hypothetical protein [Leucobacter rhizosphaerae]UOQ61395.1 hypothetical protein MUN76_05335 [Leucobacter rhizosphaerae]